MDILAVIRADAVRQRRAHVVHAAERRQLDGEAVCARAFGREVRSQARDLADVAEPIVEVARVRRRVRGRWLGVRGSVPAAIRARAPLERYERLLLIK